MNSSRMRILVLVVVLSVLIVSIASLKVADASYEAALASRNAAITVFCNRARSAGEENLNLRQAEHYRKYCLPLGGE